MVAITPITDEGMKLIQRKAKDTSKLERYIKKYDTYQAYNGDIVSLYETKGKAGSGLYAKIYTPWMNSSKVIKYIAPNNNPMMSTPVAMRETWNGQEIQKLTNKGGEWINRNGEAMLLPPRAFDWCNIPSVSPRP